MIMMLMTDVEFRLWVSNVFRRQCWRIQFEGAMMSHFTPTWDASFSLLFPSLSFVADSSGASS